MGRRGRHWVTRVSVAPPPMKMASGVGQSLRQPLGEVGVDDLELAGQSEFCGIRAGIGGPFCLALHPDGSAGRISATPLDTDRPGAGAEVPQQLARHGSQRCQSDGPHRMFGDEAVMSEVRLVEARRASEEGGVRIMGHEGSLGQCRVRTTRPV